MAHAAFNTYLFLETLEQSGRFSHEQAKDLAKALDVSQADSSELVTKSDLREVKADLKTVKAEIQAEIAQTANRVILWVVSMNAALLAIIAKGFHWY